MANKKINIPDDAKLVFQGKLFEVWSWDQIMFDGTKEIFERVVTQDGVQVIATVGDKIIIQDQEQPARSGKFLSLPGGRCEWGEDPLSCAKREFLEETGFTSDDWSVLVSINSIGKINWNIYSYIARNCKKSQDPHLDAGERIENRLMTFEEFLHLDSEDRFRSLAPTLIRAQYDEKYRAMLRAQIFGG